MLRLVPSKAVVSTFIRSQVLLGSLAETSPRQALFLIQFARNNRAGAEAAERRTHVPNCEKSTIDFHASSQA
jgi:hypothetical protein